MMKAVWSCSIECRHIIIASSVSRVLSLVLPSVRNALAAFNVPKLPQDMMLILRDPVVLMCASRV